MAAQECPNCGHTVGLGDAPGTAQLEAASPELVGIVPLGQETTQSHSTTTVQSGGRAGLLAGAVVVAAILGALIVLLPEQADPAPQQATPTTQPPLGGLDAQNEPRIISPPGLGGPAFAAIVPSFGSDPLAEVTGDFRIAYVGRDGIVLIDPTSETSTTATLPISDLSPPNVFTELPGLGLLNEGRTTYGLTDEARPTVYELYTRGNIIAGPDETVTLIAQDEADLIKVSVGTTLGFTDVATEIPSGSRKLLVPGLGLVVSPPTGRTFVARPARLELLSDHLIVAASETSHVELRCDAALSCSAWLVERTTATAVELPEEFGQNRGTLSVSPDGRWVTLNNPLNDAATDRLFERQTGAVTDLGATLKGAVSWAPDSSFAAWFDLDDVDAQLEVLVPSRAQSETIDLAELGADSPVTNTLLLF